MSESRSPLSRQQRRAEQRKLRKTRGQTALTLGAAALATVPAIPAAQAATFTVTNLNDSGAGSLRQAILDANGAVGADVVDFQAALTGTITLTTGQLEITDSVDIQGPGATALTVSGNNASRVFYLYNGLALIDVTISGLTITGGNASIGGGVVDFDENLTLDSVTITGNTATGDGGGIWADGFNMTLTIQNATVTGNSSGDDGGGMYVEDTGGPLTIQTSVFSGNDAAGSGGGIYFYDPDNDVTLVDSTISGNSSGSLGGGIYLYSPDAGLFTINRTTVSGNDALEGGGVFLYSPDHGGAIESSTISGNQATAGDGGGVYLYNLYNNFEIRHTTIAGNTASGVGGGAFVYNATLPMSHVIIGDNTAGADNDVANGDVGQFDVSFSLIEDPGGATITDSGGNIFNQDAQLGALGNHGGPTQTQVPAITSLAVNAGNAAFAPPPATDQRGLARVAGGRIDMGAVEVNPGTIQLTASAVNVAENAGTVMITATRTGGSDGAVSVTVNSTDGSAVAPGDYTAVIASLLNWADGDSAAKSLNITIVNDTADEPDETFTVTISNATGGAVLGTPVTATITIQDDDVPATVVDVPTVGDVGRVLLTALLSLSGLFLLRRKRGLAAPVLLLTLLAAEANAAAPVKPREVKVVTLSQVTTRSQVVTIQLSDGSTLQVPESAVEVADRRSPKSRKGAVLSSVQGLVPGQPLLVKVRRNPDGSVKKVRLQVFDTLERAQATLQADPK